MNNPDTWLTNYERQHAARRKLSQGNKAAVMDALAAVQISLVLITFDGEGDSGQIHGITASRGDIEVPLPETKVIFQESNWGNAEPVARSLTLEEALEYLCYDLLEIKHGGWEINEGSYGEFRFDIPARTIALEFNSRFTEVSTTHHSF